MSYKKLKKQIKQILLKSAIDETHEILNELSHEQLISSLMGLLFDPDELVKFRAVDSIGYAASIIAEKNIEKVRIIMRRLMWTLNEESGGIGWGSPEAMAAIAADSKKIYDEFAKIIISYIDPLSPSFLDHKELHPGIAWGIGRLGEKNKKTGELASYMLKKIILDTDPRIRGLGVWACGTCKISEAANTLEQLIKDKSEFLIYRNRELKKLTIAEAAKTALDIINKP